jgi:hypothetical protein
LMVSARAEVRGVVPIKLSITGMPKRIPLRPRALTASHREVRGPSPVPKFKSSTLFGIDAGAVSTK